LLRDKFKNLVLPELPKTKFFSKEQDRLEYVKQLLATILDYSKQEQELKIKLFGYLYNLLMVNEVELLHTESRKKVAPINRSNRYSE
jgi:hypothetical protein